MGTTNGPDCNGESVRRRIAAALTGSLLLVGCAGTPAGFDETSVPADARESMAAALRQCTIEYGYNPDTASQYGQTQLGSGEVDWRDCAHDALDRVLEPQLQDPDALDALIDDDEALTEAIEEGTATRAQRASVLQAHLANIRQRELALYQQNTGNLGAGAALDAATNTTEFQRLRNDIESIARLF